MATTYPTSKQTFTNPTAGSPLNSPSHAQLHDDSQDTIAALEDAVGYTGSFKFFLTTATIGAANGGTGNTSLTAHAVLLGEGTSAVGFATIGTGGRVLVDQGAGADPAFTAISGSGATITLSAGGVLTISAIANASLTNSSLTVTAGTGLSGGGSVALGGSVTLSLMIPASVANWWR